MKRCPFCAEEIQDAAIVCRYCGRDLVRPPGVAPPAAQSASAVSRYRLPWWIKVLLGFAGAAILGGWWQNTSTDRVKEKPIGTPAPPFELFVSLGLDGVQVTNETVGTWDGCTLTIEGGYQASIALLKPHDTVRVPFDQFVLDDRAVPRGEGRLRTKNSLEISCAGSDYERYRKRYTF